jgi:proteic killer suppression protein
MYDSLLSRPGYAVAPGTTVQPEVPSAEVQTIKAARVRLAVLDSATSLGDLTLPGLRLEALKGDRKGQHSIRINDRYRICFEWKGNDACAVEIVDYH